MKRHFILFHFILSTGFGSWSAQAQGQSDHFVLPPGKAIYQPKEFAGQGLVFRHFPLLLPAHVLYG